jgi:hypothetical protein
MLGLKGFRTAAIVIGGIEAKSKLAEPELFHIALAIKVNLRAGNNAVLQK